LIKEWREQQRQAEPVERVTERVPDVPGDAPPGYARPAGLAPDTGGRAMRVERRVSSRGALVIAGQRIQIGMVHAGRTLFAEEADHTIRVYDDDQTPLRRGTSHHDEEHRFKVRKPERPRRTV
jgi:hypothetical protein